VPGALPAAGLDPFSIGADQVSALKQGTPDEQRLAATILNARSNLAGLAKAGAKVAVSTGPGNGGQPVITVVPKGFDPSKPATVHTHYHGFYSTAAAPPGDQAQVTHNLTEAVGRDPQTIYVLPECKSAPMKAGAAMGKTDWSNVQSVTRSADDALLAAGLSPRSLTIKERVVSAHSGGGRALGYAMANTPDGSGLRADRIELEDCAYGAPEGTLSAVDALKQWMGTATGQAAKSVVYIDGGGGNDQKPDAELKAALGGRYSQQTVPSHFAAVASTFAR
jgi:hypothetical protein